MNAAVLVDGHAKGGAAGARTAREVSGAASPRRLASILRGRGPLDVILGRWTLDFLPLN